MAIKPIPTLHSALRDIAGGVSGPAHLYAEWQFIAEAVPTADEWMRTISGFVLNEDTGLYATGAPFDCQINGRGVYLVEARMAFAASAVGLRGMIIDADGGLGEQQRSIESAFPAVGHVMSRSVILRVDLAVTLPLNVNLIAYQSSGGNLTSTIATRLRAYKLGPLS